VGASSQEVFVNLFGEEGTMRAFAAVLLALGVMAVAACAPQSRAVAYGGPYVDSTGRLYYYPAVAAYPVYPVPAYVVPAVPAWPVGPGVVTYSVADRAVP
jgi:hypothetical protein